jgi:signal transduction histidine kinase
MWQGEQRAAAIAFQSEETLQPGVLEMRRGPRRSLRSWRCLLQAPADVVSVRRKNDRFYVRLLAGESGRVEKAAAAEWMKALLSGTGWKNALVVGFQRGNWTVRLVLMKGKRIGFTRAQGRLLYQIVQKVFPVIHNAYVFQRARQRTGALERVKIARELHDGVVQALFAIEMRLFALRKGMTAGAPLRGELKQIQDLIHDQLLSLREMISRSKATEITSDRLVGFLAEMVDKFQRDTKIAAAFQSAVDTVELPRRQCVELARIVNEALVNVRKHSGARAVLVVLSNRAHEVSVAIEDDGAGCDFRGCMSLAELDNAGVGPGMIKERVRSLGGNLQIESVPGKGTRIEVTLMKEVYAVSA